MTDDSDRDAYQTQLAARAALRAQAPSGGRRTTLALDGAAPGGAGSAEDRIRAIEMTTAKEAPPGLTIRQVIERLADDNEDPAVRQAAIAKLTQLEFFGSLLDPYRPEILEALKKAARSRVAKLVLAALDFLAAHKEPFAREMLLGFLKDPKAALIPLVKVIQLLSYDDHSDVIESVRGLLERRMPSMTAQPPSAPDAVGDHGVVEEAVRLLSSHAGSESLLARILGDKTLPTRIRSLSATGLHNLNPTLFADMAAKILDDDNEDDDLRATSLSALTHFSDYAKQRLDPGLRSKVEQIVHRAPSVHLKATASRFLDRLKHNK